MTSIELRTRLLTLLFLIAAVLLLIIPFSGPVTSAGTPQGKGGEVVAKPTPTPTPKKPSTKKTPPRTSRTSRPTKSTSDAAKAAELIFWNSIKDSASADDFKEYLKKYPDGEFAGLANNRLKNLEAAKAKPTPSPGSEPEATKTQLNSTTGTATSPAKPKAGTVVRNQSGMELVLIPPGSFMMGSTNGDPDEKPVHQVTINYSFYMGKYEVTQAQWQAVTGNNPSYFKDCGGNCPVEQVSWNDAQDFINKLNETNDGFRYRLPTEAEWEYACRAGTTGNYYGAEVNDIGWYADNWGKKTHSVGGKQPNAFGLYDMSGNVWEWCRDWYHDNYNGAPNDGSAWLSGGEQKYRVLRGGSFDWHALSLRSATRYKSPDGPSNYFGFRIVAVARTQ